MASPICNTKIHRPNLPNLVIEHISRLEENGATSVLQALGFMRTGVDGVWYDRAHLTIIENSVGRTPIRQSSLVSDAVVKIGNSSRAV